jgi:hypothetical protein
MPYWNPPKPLKHPIKSQEREQILTAQEGDTPWNSTSQQRNIQKTGVVGRNQHATRRRDMLRSKRAIAEPEATHRTEQTPQTPVNDRTHCFDEITAINVSMT